MQFTITLKSIFLIIFSTMSLVFSCLGKAADEQSLNYAQFNYVKKDPDTLNLEPDGLGFSGRWSLDENFFIRGEMDFVTEDNVDLEEQELMLAYVVNPKADLKFHLGLLAEHKDIESSTNNVHFFGKGLEVGFIWDLTRYIDFHGAIDTVYARNDVTVAGRVGLFYTFYQHLGVDVSAELDDDDNSVFKAGFRYIF